MEMAGFSIAPETLTNLLRENGHVALLRSLREDGGAGSGNWGHAGRKGLRGGSAPGGGASKRIGSKETGYSGAVKWGRTNGNKPEPGLGAAPSAPTRQANPLRQSQWKQKNTEAREATLAKKPNQQALELWKKGFLDKQTALKQAKDGSITDSVNRFYDIMDANGDPTPTKPTVADQRSVGPTLSEYGGDWTKARIGAIRKDTGMSEEEATKTKEVMDQWTGGQWTTADTATLDQYVERAPAYAGEIHRGMKFDKPEDYDAFMTQIQSGVIRMNGNSSWSSDPEVAKRFSKLTTSGVNSVVIRCVANKTATPIEHLTVYGGEDEVLAHSRTAWSVLSVQEEVMPDGTRNAYVNVAERGEYLDA